MLNVGKHKLYAAETIYVLRIEYLSWASTHNYASKFIATEIVSETYDFFMYSSPEKGEITCVCMLNLPTYFLFLSFFLSVCVH